MIPQHGTLEISRGRLRHNLDLIRARLPARAQICATIKADAYGHGLREMAGLLREAAVNWACVYNLEEARELARISTAASSDPFAILALAPFVLDPRLPAPVEILAQLSGSIRLNITDLATAEALSAALSHANAPHPLNIHIQVDAGLTRAGAAPKLAHEIAAAIEHLPGLRLEGVFAHLSHGDVPDHESLPRQLAILRTLAAPLKRRHPHLLVHLQNSGGCFHLSDDLLDLARVGIALYGLQPSTAAPIPGLQPVARVTAPIVALHDCAPGIGVGYGHTFTTSRPSRLAIVPVGYADGYPRVLSSRGLVAQILGRDAPVVGRVSMDQIILDITDIPAAAPGDIATVLSWNPDHPNSLDRMADRAGTIGYELATHLGPRLTRTLVD